MLRIGNGAIFTSWSGKEEQPDDEDFGGEAGDRKGNKISKGGDCKCHTSMLHHLSRFGFVAFDTKYKQ